MRQRAAPESVASAAPRAPGSPAAAGLKGLAAATGNAALARQIAPAWRTTNVAGLARQVPPGARPRPPMDGGAPTPPPSAPPAPAAAAGPATTPATARSEFARAQAARDFPAMARALDQYSDTDMRQQFDQLSRDDITGIRFRGSPPPRVRAEAGRERWRQVPGEPVVDGARPSDVQQRGYGDCQFLASLMAVAAARPQVIERMVRRVSAHEYEVTIFRPQAVDEVRVPGGGTGLRPAVWWQRTFDPTGENDRGELTRVRVTDSFPTMSAEPPRDRIRHQAELWVALLERAYARQQGGYQQVGQGLANTAGTRGMIAATGTAVDRWTPESMTNMQIYQALAAAIRGRLPTTCGTRRDIAAPSTPGAPLTERQQIAQQWHAQATHSYALLRVNEAGHTVDLGNPHGQGEMTNLNMSAFKLIIADVVSTRSAPRLDMPGNPDATRAAAARISP